MELHYITLLRQAKFMHSCLKGSIITASFTRKKNEMILRLDGQSLPTQELILSSDAVYPFLLLRDFRKSSGISTNVMDSLIGKQIEKISISENDRLIEFIFLDWNHRLLLQFFRNRTNFFILDPSDIIISAFKHQKKYKNTAFGLQTTKKLSPLDITRCQFYQLLSTHHNMPVVALLKKHFIFMSSAIIREITLKSGLDEAILAGDIEENQTELLYYCLKDFFTRCLNDPPRVYLKGEFPQAFSLTEMKIYTDYDVRFFKNVNEALSFYFFRKQKLDRIVKKRDRIVTIIENKIGQLEKLIAHLKSLPDEKEQRSYLQKIGELILAQMYNIPSGKAEIELTDLYDPSQKKMRVRINPELSLQENAGNYFDKARDVAQNMRQVKRNIEEHRKKLDQLHHINSIIQKELDFRDLDKIEKKLVDMHIIQTDEQHMEEVYRPYRSYFIDNWEIWVGKNAKSNDETTFRHAHKEDLWLHAQGVSGSHVIIRRSSEKKEVPKRTIEYAARLAATNSRSKTSSYVPVIVTHVKYVHKPKGTPPGTVNAERVKTIFVEPLKE
ncbi:MAG: DUF814 domain-containing protein [Calditrichaeota bacterium]|nr:DUF814 domain-containing protein [Calditrichota bacterium]